MYKLNSSKSTGLLEDNDHFLSQFTTKLPSSPSSKLLHETLSTTLSTISSSNPESNPTSLISSSISITEYEQIRLAQECLETSASYMNDIESFFQELSTKRSTPHNSNWPSNESSLATTLSIESLDNFDLDSFTFNTGSPEVIDPSVFNFTPTDSITEDEDDQAVASIFDVMHLNNNKPSRKQQNTRSRSKSLVSYDSDSLSSSYSPSVSRPKAPKFYSRSGQVADPSRGPCHNCNTTLTCYWRKLKGQYHCNACTLFFKRNKYHRSGESVTDKPIKRRNRKSKYSSDQ